MDATLAPYCIPLGSTLLDAIEAIKNNRSRCAVVLDGEKVVGVLSEGDILKALLQDGEVHGLIDPYVKLGFRFLTADDPKKALALFREHGFTLVPIVDRAFHLTGVITLSDILARCSLDAAP